MFQNAEDWLVLIGALLFLSAAISWLIFSRFTVTRIEKAIKQDGLPRPCQWDGPGARILWYAYAISLPIGRFNQIDDPLIDVALVRRYAKPADKIWGLILIIAATTGSILATVGWLIWG